MRSSFINVLVLLTLYLFFACSKNESELEISPAVQANLRQMHQLAEFGSMYYMKAIDDYEARVPDSVIVEFYEQEVRMVFKKMDSLLDAITILYATDSINGSEYQYYLDNLGVDEMKVGLDSLKALGLKFNLK